VPTLVDLAVVAPFLAMFAVPPEQQAVHLHDAVDALGIERCASILIRLAAQQGMHATIAVGGQAGDEHADVGDQLGVRQRRSSTRSWRRPVAHRE
jgi:hypothetical protein